MKIKSSFTLLILIVISTLVVKSYASKSSFAIDSASLLTIDTIPPIVTIFPKEKYQSSVFHVTAKTNKRAIIWVGLGSLKKVKPFSKPIPIVTQGYTKFYFYAEDDFGNKSSLDSVEYILDMNPPQVQITPSSGIYTRKQIVRISVNEFTRMLLVKNISDTMGIGFVDSLEVKERLEGYVLVIDSAGNRTISKKLDYTIKKVAFDITLFPRPDLYNIPQHIRFKKPNDVSIFYTFDPSAPPDWFIKYEDSVALPIGMSLLRYYGKGTYGEISEIVTARYLLDTLPPKLTLRVKNGVEYDSIYLSTKDKSLIFYTSDGSNPSNSGNLYENVIVLKRIGLVQVNAIAKDEAGNVSEVEEYKQKYDFAPPVITPSTNGGNFTKSVLLYLVSNESARIFYTLDGSLPNLKSSIYSKSGIVISKEGNTELQYFGIDDANNQSSISMVKVNLDSKPPIVRARLDGNLREGDYQLSLIANESGTIHYEIATSFSGNLSQVYKSPINMRVGQTIHYRATDIFGNVGPVISIDELRRPMINAEPEGNVYNRRLAISLHSNVKGTQFYRVLPDTAFQPVLDGIILEKEGAHTIEFFIETPEGLRSIITPQQYFLDWTAPKVELRVRKAINDSVAVFFNCSENATIYYSLDGSNPFYGSNSKIAGNKLFQSKDRIVIKRSSSVKLAFYAEDAAGNQSQLTVVDVFHPRVIPNVPAGKERVYDRILSISLNTFDQSSVYYKRHGAMPSTESEVYREPLTLMESDTIIAFAIDASGYKGTPDTFIYLIDLPPSPQFFINKDSIFVGETLEFDASSTLDKETPFNKLYYQWDFDGDGKFDTDSSREFRTRFLYSKPGVFHPLLQVIDNRKRVARTSKEIVVMERCHESMVSVVDNNGHSFCIDRYEWPNVPGKIPLTSVSWVEAKMHCIDAGKRLCTEKEWSSACEGNFDRVYPYGDRYDKERCPTEGNVLFKSGSFKKCSRNGVYDMVGNIWEWVDDTSEDYRDLAGGSYKFGKDAHCGFRSKGTIATRAPDIGFRCCK